MTDNPFFKKFSKEYAKSKSHRYGSDLLILSEMIDPDNDLCLDIASGTGFTTAELSKKCKKVIGIDQTKSMIDKAAQFINSQGIKNVDLINSDFETANFESKFNVITIRRALHHFKDKDLFFRRCSEIIILNGFLIISDMLSSDGDVDDVLNKLERLRDNTHVAALKEKDYENYFRKYNFITIRKEITVERLAFSEWLYPIDSQSKIAQDCINFLKGKDDKTLRLIGFNIEDMTLDKKRIVIKAKKVNI